MTYKMHTRITCTSVYFGPRVIAAGGMPPPREASLRTLCAVIALLESGNKRVTALPTA
jgi:hypothetical protein